MKKVFAVVLALVIALSMSTIAFADDEVSTSDLAPISDVVSKIVNATGIGTGTDIFTKITNAAAEALESIASIDLSISDDGIIATIINDFREVLEDVGISTTGGTLAELFSNLKQRIKEFFEGSSSTTPVVEKAEPIANTGSSATAAIAAFASISVAAAAAFVCTKKKAVA